MPKATPAPAPATLPQLLPIRLLAAYLGLGVNRTRALVNAGEISSIDVPGVGRRVLKADADAYIKALRATARNKVAARVETAAAHA